MHLPLRCAGLLLLGAALPLRAQRPTPSSAPQPFRWGAVVDAVADLSPGAPTRPDSARFALRTLELNGTAPVARRVSAAFTVNATESGRVAIDEARFIATLPLRARLSAGRFQLPVSDWWNSHRHENPLIERPLSLQRFLGSDVASGSGIMLAQGGPHATATLAVVDRIVEPVAGRVTIERANHGLGGLGYVARLTWGTRQRALGRVQLSASGATSLVAQPLSASAPQGTRRVNAVLARQSVVTGGLRWTSAARRVDVRGEYVAQVNEGAESVASRIPADLVNGGPYYRGPSGTFAGGYAMAEWHAVPMLSIAARGETLQDPELNGRQRRVLGAGLEWGAQRPLRLRAAYEHRSWSGASEQRVLLEGVALFGSHRGEPR